MRWDLLPDLSAFNRARRREAYRRLSRAVRGEQQRALVDLDEVRERLGVIEESYMGIRAVPVARIVGTAGRSRDFDRDFLPRDLTVRERWRRVEQAFPRGDFPPIVAYEVDDLYFVVDGHHRVAVAKQRGVEMIDAEVTRLRTRAGLPPDADMGALIHAGQRRLFEEQTGLAATRPSLRIEFTQPLGYVELLELVEAHAYHLCVERGEVVTIEEAAEDWVDRVYTPAIETIRRERLAELFPVSTEADLFLWVYQRRRAFFPEHGGLTFEEAARRARD